MNPPNTNFGTSPNSGDHLQLIGNETAVFWSTVVRCLFPLLICASLSLGFQVPLFYNWSGSQQSHTPPIVGYVFAGFLGACCVSLLALPFLPKLKRDEPIRSPLIQPFRFPIVAIISTITIMGFFVFRDVTMVIIGAALFLYAMFCAVRLGLASPSLRWRIVSLYSCMYLPFVWVFTNDVFQSSLKQGSFVLLPILAGAPTLVCSLFISRFGGEQQAASAVVVAGLEVLFGLWVIQLGARRSIAYQIVLLAVSVITSFGLHAMLRA